MTTNNRAKLEIIRNPGCKGMPESGIGKGTKKQLLGLRHRHNQAIPRSNEVRLQGRHTKTIKMVRPEQIRTPDLLVRSQTLYPTELRAQLLNYHGSNGMIGLAFAQCLEFDGLFTACIHVKLKNHCNVLDGERQGNERR